MGDKRELLIGVKISRKIGDTQIEWSLSEYRTLETQGDVERAYSQITNFVADMMLRYESDNLHKFGNGGGGGGVNPLHPANDKAAVNGTSRVSVPVAKLAIGFDKGQRTVRVFGGKYQKHGVAVYPEYYKHSAYPVNLKDGAFGEYEYEGFYAIIELEGDKPVRVLSIERD